MKKVLNVFQSFSVQLLAFIYYFFLPTIIAVAYIGTYVAKDFIPTTLSLFFRFYSSLFTITVVVQYKKYLN